MDRSWLGETPMTVGVLGGRLTFQQELGLPFEMEIVSALDDFGLANENTEAVERAYPDLPKFEPNMPPTAALGVDDLLVGVGLYLAGALTDATVSAVVDELYQNRILPALKRLWQRVRSRSNQPKTTRVKFDHWFDGSKVLVRIEFLIAPEDNSPSPDTIRSCLQVAVEWINSNPRTHRVLTFTSTHGVLQSAPRLSEPIL